MLYTDIDLPTLERHAFIDGRADVADLAGQLIDAEQEAESLQDALEKAESERAATEEKLDTFKADVRYFLDDLYSTVEDAARVSNRDKILAAIRDFKTD